MEAVPEATSLKQLAWLKWGMEWVAIAGVSTCNSGKLQAQGKKLGPSPGTKVGMNCPPMAPHGLILSQDGGTPSRMFFRRVLHLFDVIFMTCWH